MTLKQKLFLAASASGAVEAVADSRWRRHRLMVLCYHGISMADEHEWDDLYMSQSTFRGRLQYLQSNGYNVLALDEAMRRLHEGTLPPRAVAITFDDGAQDFSTRALPVLQEFNFPATLYLTTYYCDVRLPVFDTALSYVVWQGRAHAEDIASVIGSAKPLLLQPESDRRATVLAIRHHAAAHEFSALDKDALLESVASTIGVNMAAIRRDGMLHIMAPETVRALPSPLIDVQLHTHRHRTPHDERKFRREIADNRDCISEMLPYGRALTHFCYPSGVYAGVFLPWLRAEGVHYATTCIPDITQVSSEPLLLPRFVDTEHQPIETFAAWVSGIAALIPRRKEHRLNHALLAEG